MSPRAIYRLAITLLTLGAAAALVWGVWVWVGRRQRRRGGRATRGSPVAPPLERQEALAATSRPPDEPCPPCRSGWSLDLSDEP